MAKNRIPKSAAAQSARNAEDAPAAMAALAPDEKVNKSRLIQDILADAPDRGPKDIADELTAMGVPTTPKYVSTIKTNMKTAAGLPKRKIRLKKAGSRSTASSNVASGTSPPQTAALPASTTDSAAAAATREAGAPTELTFEHLKMAKEMARQLGGVDQARAVLQALMQLTE